MSRQVLFLLVAAGLSISISPGVSRAQDAAETAIILGGTGAAQGRAQKSLGSAVSRSVGNAATVVAAPQRTRQGTPRRTRPHQRTGPNFAIALPGDVDPLGETGAPTYDLANGVSIRVSGGLRRSIVPTRAGAPTDPE